MKKNKLNSKKPDEKISLNRNTLLIIAVLIIVIICLIVIGSLGESSSKSSHDGQVQVPFAASKMKGRDYQDVIKEFEKQGFTNIRTEKIEDLILGFLTKDGEVEQVSVGGNIDYTSDKWVYADVEVIITYHTFPSKETPDISESSSSSIWSSSISESSTNSPVSSSTTSSSTVSSSVTSTSSSSETISSSVTNTSSSSNASSSSASSTPQSTASSSSRITYDPVEESNGITLVSFNSNLVRNENATITVKGKPNTEYTINVYYSSGPSKAEGLEKKKSDANGMVSWTWHVGGRTNLGNNKKITITGGGDTYTTTFAVVD